MDWEPSDVVMRIEHQRERRKFRRQGLKNRKNQKLNLRDYIHKPYLVFPSSLLCNLPVSVGNMLSRPQHTYEQVCTVRNLDENVSCFRSEEKVYLHSCFNDKRSLRLNGRLLKMITAYFLKPLNRPFIIPSKIVMVASLRFPITCSYRLLISKRKKRLGSNYT